MSGRERKEVLARLACQIVTMLPENPADADETLALAAKIMRCLAGDKCGNCDTKSDQANQPGGRLVPFPARSDESG